MHLVGCTIEIYCDTRPCERHILSSLLFFNFVYLKKSRDSVGGIVTRLLAGRSWVHILAGTRDFSLLRNVQGGSVAHPSPCSVGGYRLGREIDHSLVVPTSSMSGEIHFLPLMP